MKERKKKKKRLREITCHWFYVDEKLFYVCETPINKNSWNKKKKKNKQERSLTVNIHICV